MSRPVAYPLATSRLPRETYGQALFGAIRPVTDVHFCTSSLVSAGGESGR